MAKQGNAKRHVHRIEVTSQAVKQIEGITASLGITQIAIASKLVIWFAKQSPLIQQAILGAYPDEVGSAAAELVVRAMLHDEFGRN